MSIGSRRRSSKSFGREPGSEVDALRLKLQLPMTESSR